MDVRKAAEAARDCIVSIRREFHQHPELSMQEFRTAQRIEEELDHGRVQIEEHHLPSKIHPSEFLV